MVMLLKQYGKANVSLYAVVVQKKKSAIFPYCFCMNGMNIFRCAYNLEYFCPCAASHLMTVVTLTMLQTFKELIKCTHRAK